MDKCKLEVVYDLGVILIKVFWNIIVLMMMLGIVIGFILVFVFFIGMFVVLDVMGGLKVVLIGNVI